MVRAFSLSRPASSEKGIATARRAVGSWVDLGGGGGPATGIPEELLYTHLRSTNIDNLTYSDLPSNTEVGDNLIAVVVAENSHSPFFTDLSLGWEVINTTDTLPSSSNYWCVGVFGKTVESLEDEFAVSLGSISDIHVALLNIKGLPLTMETSRGVSSSSTVLPAIPGDYGICFFASSSAPGSQMSPSGTEHTYFPEFESVEPRGSFGYYDPAPGGDITFNDNYQGEHTAVLFSPVNI